MENRTEVPMLFPFDPSDFCVQLRKVIKEEVNKSVTDKALEPVSMEVKGMVRKPLYKLKEICDLFRVSRPTIYDWVKHGKLKPVKIRSRVYFLGDDIDLLIGKSA